MTPDMSDQSSRGYPPHTFHNQDDVGFQNPQAFAIAMAQQSQNPSDSNQHFVNQNPPGYLSFRQPTVLQEPSTQWQSHLQGTGASHVADSQRSSMSTDYRYSGSSVFSQQFSRYSCASTNTSWSGHSSSSRNHDLQHTESGVNPNVPMASAGPSIAPPRARSSRAPCQKPTLSCRENIPEGWLTCVKRLKRDSQSKKEPRYWCTSCGEGFQNKSDWKRHEEVYQERFDLYPCDLCDKPYFLDKDFRNHHQKGHSCARCVKTKQHAESARLKREPRRVWGCGICEHYDTKWEERCRHVAKHFEDKENPKKIKDWKHSQVILSLLRQDDIYQEWIRLLGAKRVRKDVAFGWNKGTTGRAEGFPDHHSDSQLQDKLEFFTPGRDDPRKIVELAFEKGHRPLPDGLGGSAGPSRQGASLEDAARHREADSRRTSNEPERLQVEVTQSSNQSQRVDRSGKELPPDPPSPPVPPKKDENPPVSFRSQTGFDFGLEWWDPLVNTILEDPFPPTDYGVDMMELDPDSFLQDLEHDIGGSGYS
ncbi:hypothetical protein BCR34DRAFT_665693 [Clohesyomyces aquaticus]|uniref:C2H2-type domain-containing protein n=1 Tax=Clohesyomyces aquaticus TaxID=1231657 RepID=A0A1Y1ZFV0_9PLEO|nr:hypothetical protein BCR34DRAFT_665693 [Clohesyomyces aquaticus]